MKIRTLSFISLSIAVILFLFTGFIIQDIFSRLIKQTERLQRIQAYQINLNDIQVSVNRQVLLGVELVRNEDLSSGKVTPYRMAETRLKREISQLESIIETEEELAPFFEPILERAIRFSERCGQDLLEPLYQHKEIDSNLIESMIYQDLNLIDTAVNTTRNHIKNLLREDLIRQNRMIRNILYIFLPAVALLFLLILGGSFLIIRKVLKSIENTRISLQGLTHGMEGLQIELALSGKDEVTELCRDFNSFVEHLRAQKQALRSVALNHMDQGESLMLLTDSHSTAVAQMKNSLMEMNRQSEDTNSQVKKSEMEIDRILEALESLDSYSQVQHQHVKRMESKGETLFQAMNIQKIELDNQVKLVDSVKREGLSNLSLLQDLESKIHLFSTETLNITEALGGIKDLAVQTDILAVNASIQAARAGKWGNGFVVVTKEMHKLSSKVKNITEQIDQWMQQFSLRLVEMTQEVGNNHNAMKVLLHQNDNALVSVEALKTSMISINQQITEFQHFLAQGKEGAQRVSDQTEVLRAHGFHISQNMKEVCEQQASFLLEWNDMSQTLELLNNGTMQLSDLSEDNNSRAQLLEKEISRIGG